MRVLVACEFSGIVREAFARRGHDAWSCDLLDTEIPGQHIQGDIRQVDITKFDLMIAHPPCTRLANSGVMWLSERNLWTDMMNGALFFQALLNLPVPKICVENPIPHHYALDIIGHKYDQIIQPWQFGHGETKATCLWLKNLPKLIPTNIVSGREQRIRKLSALRGAGSSKTRQQDRSRTFPGIAQAMAEQWG